MQEEFFVHYLQCEPDVRIMEGEEGRDFYKVFRLRSIAHLQRSEQRGQPMYKVSQLKKGRQESFFYSKSKKVNENSNGNNTSTATDLALARGIYGHFGCGGEDKKR